MENILIVWKFIQAFIFIFLSCKKERRNEKGWV